MTPAPAVRIRPLAAEDLDAIVTLEQTTFPDPWTRGCFLDSAYRAGGQVLVATVHDKFAGYGVAWIEGELHIANIAVAPEHRRRGVGSRLLAALEDFGRRNGTTSVYLEVRRSNTGAQTFYRNNGFVQTGERAGYYPTGASRRESAVLRAEEAASGGTAAGEDALIFERETASAD